MESSFNTMGDILGKKCSRTAVKTYSSIQAIKYHLKSRDINSISFFKDCPLKNLPSCVRTASHVYRKELDRKKEKGRTAKTTKTSHRAHLEKRLQDLRERHVRRLKRNASLTLLSKKVKQSLRKPP